MAIRQRIGATPRRGAQALGALLVLLGGQTILAGRGAAQTAFGSTQFAWPDTTVDVATYGAVDQCLGATRRIADAIADRGWQNVWKDTMPWNPHERLAPLPAPVQAAAERCAARFDAHTASLTDFALLATLYLQAGRDTDVATLLTRRSRELGSAQHAARDAVVDTVLRAYLEARPARLKAAAALLHRSPPASRVMRLQDHFLLAAGAFSAGDTAAATQAGVATLAIADSLTPAERESPAFQTMGGIGGDRLLQLLAYFAAFTAGNALDSLRQSTAAYVRYMHGLEWARGAMPAIGQRAPRIVADYWLPDTAAAEPHPMPGRVALVAFLNHGDCLQGSSIGMRSIGAPAAPPRCFQLAAILHRLAQRFPTMQITTVTYTHGTFAYVPPPSAAEEATLIERELAAFHLPGAIAISATHVRRLPPPDGRRIDEPDPNVTAYGFGAEPSAALSPLGQFYLIDRNGIVVDAAGSNGSEIARLTTLADILIHRTDAPTTSRFLVSPHDDGR